MINTNELSNIENLSLNYTLTNILPVATQIIKFIDEICLASIDMIEDRRHISEEDLNSICDTHSNAVDEIMKNIDGKYFEFKNPIHLLSDDICDNFEHGYFGGDVSKPIVDVTDIYSLMIERYPFIAEADIDNYDFDLSDRFSDIFDISNKIAIPLSNKAPSSLLVDELIDNGHLGLLSYQDVTYIYGLTFNSKHEIETYLNTILLRHSIRK